jgi:hypothetical protein
MLDAGASLMKRKTNVEAERQLEDVHHKFLNFKFSLEVDVPNLNKII